MPFSSAIERMYHTPAVIDRADILGMSMNVEKTMEFILQHQAKAEVEMAAIRKLIRAGMKMIVKNEENIKALAEIQKKTDAELRDLAAAQKMTEAKLRELAAAQKITETKLQAFIDSLRRGGNGRHSKN